MPYLSDRQRHANALLEAFILQTILDSAQESTSVHDSDHAGSDWNTDSESNEESDDASNASSGWGMEVEDESSVPSLVIDACQKLYKNFYIEERRKIPKTCENLNILLTEYKTQFPDIFRSYLRITPECFDNLLNSIQHHEVFQNNSNNPQMPVERQLAIALFRFGHFGNGASTLKVALWAGVGYGTVRACTNRIMRACCDERFRGVVMQWPSDEDIEGAKNWVEAHSCPAWRDGWLMVDGTLIPMFQRPHHFGSAYFDRKSNYSANVQVSVFSTSHMFYINSSIYRLSIHLIYESLTMVLVFLAVNMMPQLGSTHGYHRNICACSKVRSLYGQTLHILSELGARHHTRSKIHFLQHKYTTNSSQALKNQQMKTHNITTMFHAYEYDRNTVWAISRVDGALFVDYGFESIIKMRRPSHLFGS